MVIKANSLKHHIYKRKSVTQSTKTPIRFPPFCLLMFESTTSQIICDEGPVFVPLFSIHHRSIL